ncbi:hypothetical protein IRZ83_05040 [Flavobacterium sp. JLP]|uniref:hypothetical protein n=1 Tax=Flavobacterium sp. JLP TaxID=2783793 RepID=UPI00188CBC26|nr:hypothetical protein [Flavobacterium sp. JLP]MBF4506026.1 hypothetical protein [Flavobacterium sp. JLP]
MATIKFNSRWKEELVATSEEGSLVFEFTMGEYNVYFPTKDVWQTSAPEWAKQKWATYLDECKIWCTENNIPITIVDNGTVYEDKNSR